MRISNLGEKPLTYLITDGTTTAENLYEKKSKILKIITAAVQANISLIQIREKQLPARLLFELTSEAVELTKQTKTKLLVNDRADIALAAKADGVHLTSKSLPTKIIRDFFPAEFIIGVSAHTIEKAELAQAQSADFVTFSPIFDSPGKGAPQGTGKLQEVCSKLKNFPVLALGGIDETNFAAASNAGASGWAAIRWFNSPNNLRAIAEKPTKQNE